MNLLDQIKPADSTTNKIDVTVEEVIITEPEVVTEEATEEAIEEVVTVTSLDSGEVQTITVSELPDLAETAETANSANSDKSDNTIYDVQSYCYKYLMYSKEFTKLLYIDPNLTKKFITEIEVIHSQRDDQTNQDLIKYLNKNYSRMNFTMTIEVNDFPNRRPMTIVDSIHFKDDYVIVPKSYDIVIDSILNGLDHNFKRIKFLDILGTVRDIKPTNEFKIEYTNQDYCHTCKFFSVCDETKIK